MSFNESSLEFDLYEDMRRKLTVVLEEAGHDPVEAERAALYVIQGVREVPKLLNALAGSHTSGREVLALLAAVLDKAPTLDKARAVLEGRDERPVH